MLTYSFCFLAGLGTSAEQRLWHSGVLCWSDYLRLRESPFGADRHERLLREIGEAQSCLAAGDWDFFFKKLPVSERHRLLPHLSDRLFYLDIETTGLDHSSVVTSIAVSDGVTSRFFLRGVDLNDFCNHLRADHVLVTYNGSRFDVPFLRRELSLPIENLHVDLCPVLRARGYRGGLKRIETLLGVRRGTSIGVDGLEAIRLWNMYQAGSLEALERLRTYNLEDVGVLTRIVGKLHTASLGKHPLFSPFPPCSVAGVR